MYNDEISSYNDEVSSYNDKVTVAQIIKQLMAAIAFYTSVYTL